MYSKYTVFVASHLVTEILHPDSLIEVLPLSFFAAVQHTLIRAYVCFPVSM